MRYVVTGGTGFIGRRVVSSILARCDDAEVWVLTRRRSLAPFERLAAEWGERVNPLVGDLTEPGLGLTGRTELESVEHVVHCAAIYDVTASERARVPPTWRAPGRSSRWHRPSGRPCTTCRRSRWPAITPSSRLNPGRAISAEHAAAMVVRGLIEKPARIDTPLGTLAELGHYLTPMLSRRTLHQLSLAYPDSAAARGEAATPGASPPPAPKPGARGGGPVRRPARSSARYGWFRVCTGRTPGISLAA